MAKTKHPMDSWYAPSWSAGANWLEILVLISIPPLYIFSNYILFLLIFKKIKITLWPKLSILENCDMHHRDQRVRIDQNTKFEDNRSNLVADQIWHVTSSLASLASVESRHHCFDNSFFKWSYLIALVKGYLFDIGNRGSKCLPVHVWRVPSFANI